MACSFPYMVKAPQGYGRIESATVPVPCGRCPECVQKRVSQWVFRLRQQEKVSMSSLFVTLTYDTDYVPITKNGYMSLRRRDVQLFFKRLRFKANSKYPIKYYLCGEYGTVRRRPHYHLIVFNSDGQSIEEAWTINGSPIGAVHYGTVTSASIAYTAKYMAKGRVVPEHSRDDREKEFSLMSKGLGLNYITDAVVQWHKENLSRAYVINEGGSKVAIPRYYRDRIYSFVERWQQNILVADLAVLKEQERRSEYFTLYPEHSDGDYERSKWYEKVQKIAEMAQTQKRRDKD